MSQEHQARHDVRHDARHEGLDPGLHGSPDQGRHQGLQQGRHRVDGPEDMDDATRALIVREIEEDRRAERWLVPRTLLALAVVAGLVLIGSGLFR